MNLEFAKMHGLGNDFMVIDNITQSVEVNRDVVQRLAHRNKGIGFDQLLLVEPPVNPETDFHFRIFNANGTEAQQCGNGMRCLAKFVRDTGLTWKNRISATTMSGKVRMSLEKSGLVSVHMGTPSFEPSRLPLNRPEQEEAYEFQINSELITMHCLSIGNPHALLFVDDIRSAPVENLGPLIGQHEDFPEQTNVGFVQIVDNSHIKVRVYERGSGETLACGSGACAAMVAAYKAGFCNNNIRVDLPGGHLFVRWPGGNKSVQMTGPATLVYKGNIKI
jgi:diaminopimelate epimerase